MEEILNIRQAAQMLGVSVLTLKKWDTENKLKPSFKTVGGHRRYKLSAIEEFTGNHIDVKPLKKKAFIYCRVSTKKRESAGNLKRQKDRLQNYCTNKNYEIVKIFSEVASGINENRHELTNTFKRLHEVDIIVVEYNDRLARFGYKYLEAHAESIGVEIESVEKNEKADNNEEMINDIISIITSFSARIYGARGGKKVKETLETLKKEGNQQDDDDN
jgi:predicted site-specific integrase-resolvase